MSRTTLFSGLALVLMLGTAHGRMIDHDLTADGVHRTWSELVDAIPTAWDVLVNRTPLSEPADFDLPSALPTFFDAAENGSAGVLGHVVRIGHPNGAGRHVWGVYDRMAAIPSPMLLYFHDGRLYDTARLPRGRAFPTEPRRPGAAGVRGGSSASPSRAGGTIEQTDDLTTTPIPEPNTMLSAVVIAAGLLLRRQRRRPSRRQARDH